MAVAPETSRSVTAAGPITVNGASTGQINGAVIDTGALWSAPVYVKVTTTNVNASSAANILIYTVSTLGQSSVPMDVIPVGSSPNPYLTPALPLEPGLQYNIVAQNLDPVSGNTITAQLVVDETTGVG